jgi:AraC family transcriptional regulator of adaptative response/methylated-DNA-[protein]-cysteine methyltransferase
VPLLNHSETRLPIMNQSSKPNEDDLYQALVNRDSSLEGIFYFGVKTTGIFCRPTCSARKPKKENVEYFESVQTAMDSGYRPCKVCTPLASAGQAPDWLTALLDEVHANPEASFKDEDLQARSVDPARVRRWFQKHHDMTFHAYIKALRINRAFEKMKNNEAVTSTAFDSGYESLSGFHQAFSNSTGFSPSQSKKQGLVNITRLSTPLGQVYAGASENGLCLLEFTDRKMIDDQIAQLQKQLKARFVPGLNRHLAVLETQLTEYFSGQRRKFDLELDVQGSEFQQKAWQALLQIPYGETRSYAQQAITTGNEKAVRAIASANAKNRIAIVIPCHRVIAKNGGLAGFGGGVWRKKYLLDLEKRPQSD